MLHGIRRAAIARPAGFVANGAGIAAGTPLPGAHLQGECNTVGWSGRPALSSALSRRVPFLPIIAFVQAGMRYAARSGVARS